MSYRLTQLQREARVQFAQREFEKPSLRDEDASHGRYEDQQFAIKVLATQSICEECGRDRKKEQ